jgi:hypothetical protein
MKKHTRISRFFIAIIMLASIASPVVVYAKEQQIWKVLIARMPRPNTQKPGGDFSTVSGGIYVPESARTSPSESESFFLARFTKEVNFQVVAFDPKKGQNDGAGIENVQIDIVQIDPNTQQELPVYQRTEKAAGYCPFGGDQPCKGLRIGRRATWPEGQQIKSGKYRAKITINPQSVIWFFDFEISPG